MFINLINWDYIRIIYKISFYIILFYFEKGHIKSIQSDLILVTEYV